MRDARAMIAGRTRDRGPAPGDRASIGEVRGTGAFFALELVKDRQTREPLVEWQGKESLNAFVADLLSAGLYVYSRFNTIIIAPPLVIEPPEIEHAVEMLDAALTRLEDAAQ